MTALPDDPLRLESEDNLALLLINSPRRRNALSAPILAALQNALSRIAHDERVGAVVIGSAMEGVFASGGDIRELQALQGSTAGLHFAQSAQRVFQAIESFPRPVVAAIDGYCLGAGAELVMAADMRIASDRSVFASPQVGLGITPGLGGGQRLLRLCGRASARRLILTGERIDAAEALRLGLVESVVPPAVLWDTAKAIAMRLASKPREALERAKRMVNYASQAGLTDGCAYEASQFGLACAVGYLRQRGIEGEGVPGCG